jgi:hypothetical protein
LVAAAAWALAHRAIYDSDSSCPYGALTQIITHWPGLLLIAGPPALVAAAAFTARDRWVKALAAAGLLDEIVPIVLLGFLPSGSLC